MTPEAQRIAIAEACGARWHWISDRSGTFLTFKEWDGEFVKLDEPHNRSFIGHDIPDYLNDLNAMHEAEKALDGSDWHGFTMELRRVIVRECNKAEHYHPNHDGLADFWFYHASAAQRTEAFLRTLNLWTE